MWGLARAFDFSLRDFRISYPPPSETEETPFFPVAGRASERSVSTGASSLPSPLFDSDGWDLSASVRVADLPAGAGQACRGLFQRYPSHPAGDVGADAVGDVLVDQGHLRAGPAHDVDDRAFGHPQEQQVVAAVRRASWSGISNTSDGDARLSRRSGGVCEARPAKSVPAGMGGTRVLTSLQARPSESAAWRLWRDRGADAARPCRPRHRP